MTKAHLSAIGALVIVVAILGILFSHKGTDSQAFGASNIGTVVPNLQWFSGGIRIGDNNSSQLSEVLKGTCNITGPTLAATSTAQYFCTVTGVKAGDNVFADLPVGAGANNAGAGSLSGGFNIVAAYATTTNRIGITISNLTGAATSSFAQATTSVEYFVIR